MKLRHAAAFALVVALGCLAPGCTRHPSWRVVQAPLKPCGVGPSDPAFLGYLKHVYSGGRSALGRAEARSLHMHILWTTVDYDTPLRAWR